MALYFSKENDLEEGRLGEKERGCQRSKYEEEIMELYNLIGSSLYLVGKKENLMPVLRVLTMGDEGVVPVTKFVNLDLILPLLSDSTKEELQKVLLNEYSKLEEQ